MHFMKSQAYNLSPDEYLQKFHNPHQTISQKGSPELDDKDIQTIQQVLEKSYNDNSQTGQQKQKAVKQLQQIVNVWIAQNCDQELSEEYGLKIFGSYSLKAHSFDGDIDMICIVPEFFTREKHFFGMLARKLRGNENVKELFPIPDAYVPIIKLTFYGVQIDLLIARIQTQYLNQRPNLLTEIQKFPIGQKELKCMNGYRTSLYLLKSIKKYKNFQVALKAIKMWARNKGIYSQIYGYLGGAAFSIMLAKICQLYPNYSALQLLDRFFFIYANWVWTVPVMLEKVGYMDPTDDQMTIYTPFEPFINSAYGVSKMTSFITKKYLKAASQLVQQINKGKKTWKNLFEAVKFFQEYRYFVQISVMGENQQEFVPWKGTIESKLRKFVRFFQMQQDIPPGIELIPYPRSFECPHPSYKICVKYYMGIRLSSNSPLIDNYELDFTQIVKDFLNLLDNYPAIDKSPKIINIGFSCIPRQKIPQEALNTFKNEPGRETQYQNST